MKKMRMNRKLIVAAGAVVLGLGTIAGVKLTKERMYGGELVAEVIDGDTFILEGKRPVRLYSVNAPELGNCGADEARAFLSKLILGKRVWLTDTRATGGRVMAMVYSKGKLINLEMIKSGWVESLAEYSGEEKETMREANENARKNQVGIFSQKCYQKDPPDSKCRIKGNITEKERRRIYFRPDCPNYDQVVVEKYMGEKWFCSEAEAKKEGFVAAGGCEIINFKL